MGKCNVQARSWAQSKGPLTPPNMVILFGSRSCPFQSPHVLFILMSIHHSLTAPSWVRRSLDQLLPRGDGTRSLSPMPGTIPLLVCIPFSLGMTHRFPQVSASSCRKTEPGVPGVSALFCLRGTWQGQVHSGVPWQKEPRGLIKHQA